MRGYTILEVFIVSTICILLFGLGYASLERAKERARKAACISHLRSFHGALSSAITDNGEWPQVPLDNGAEWDEEMYYEWWIIFLEKYGVGRDAWVCPSDQQSRLRLKGVTAPEDDVKFFGSYAISRFEPGASTPFRYNQPWMVERGAYHGVGGHVLMPDGSVSTRINPFTGR